MNGGLDRIFAGISVDDALCMFQNACGKPGTLEIPKNGFAPRLAKLRMFLSDPITGEEAEALRDAVTKKQTLDDVLEWLEYAHGISWRDYIEHKSCVTAELELVKQEFRLKDHRAWLEKIKAWPRPACMKCNSPASVVPIIRGPLELPLLPTFGLFVRGGCHGGTERWHCKKCRRNLREPVTCSFTPEDVGFLKRMGIELDL